MHRRQLMLLALGSLLTVSGGYKASAEEQNDHALIESVGHANLTLQQGLVTAAQQGQPLSAKFEIDDGKLQLSVYTAKDGNFFQVIVDYTTGKIARSAAITEDDDVTAAKAQAAAMMQAKTDLTTAVQAAGSRAVSVTPALKDGRAVALITLIAGRQFKTVEQSLE